MWLVNAYREGERSQLRALAEALAWPWQEKNLVYKKFAARTNLLRGSDLSGIDLTNSSSLQPPWPDLILSAGMRNEPVCRWIRDQSGGQSRIVHLGRPWADPSRFDLVITTPQYRLPRRANVLHNVLPLNRVDQERLVAEGERWQNRLVHLPKPHIAVVVGGNSGPYAFGVNAAKRLRENAIQMAADKGGSLLITTSARTDLKVVEVLRQIEGVPAHVYHWQAGDADNPYFAFLAMADELIVTADSISMLSEACATGKPVWMFDLTVGRDSMSGNPELNPGWSNDFSFSAAAYKLMMRWLWQRLSRDITLVHRALVSSGRARWLGDATTTPNVAATGQDMERAVARIRDLMSVSALPGQENE